MLSYITIGRNDNYGGAFDFRLRKSLDHNFALLNQYEVPFEMIFVEWNPIKEKQLLSERLIGWYPSADIKCYVCDSSVHDFYLNQRETKVKFFEYHAKNVGLKRASMPFSLLTNSDILLSDIVINQLLNIVPCSPSNCVFRATRLDCDLGDVSESDILGEELLNNRVVNVNKITPPLFSNASGDFALGRTDCLQELTGYDEKITTTVLHQDSRFLLNARANSCMIIPLGHIYHFDHDNSFNKMGDAKPGLGDADWGKMQQNIPFVNKTWGLDAEDGFTETKISERMWKIKKETT